MFSLTLRFISYIFSILIALSGILFVILMSYLITDPYPVTDAVVTSLGLPITAVLSPWILGVTGILLLGPISLLCVNFFQQTKIIELLEAQNNKLSETNQRTEKSEDA